MLREMWLKNLGVSLLLTALSLNAGLGLAFTFPLPDGTKARAGIDFGFLSQDFDFNGIVKLSNCSGSLIRYEHSERDDAAMILTNGHCVGRLAPNTAQYQQRSRRWFKLFQEDGDIVGRVYASELEYATMTGTDIALYRLKKTYREIEDEYGVSAFTLSRQGPAVGDDIEIISGYWHRGYECSVEKIVHHLKEGRWDFYDSLRYSRPGCQTIGGTSGSPIILKGSKTVVAINNTGNESGLRCSLNNPCELNEDGDVFYQKGYSYGQQVDLIYSCLDAELRIDLEQEGCLLQRSGASIAAAQ